MRNKKALALLIVLTVASLACFGWRKTSGNASAVKNSPSPIKQEPASLSYNSLNEAIEAARFSVRFEKQTTFDGLANAYHAPNPVQNYDAYIAEGGADCGIAKTQFAA
ncbi:MAG: hypothetical protein ABR568_17120 [Pyrinomonadaceae bacterium]